MRKRNGNATDILYPVVTIGLVVLAWEVLTRFSVIPAYALPAPGDVFVVLVQQWSVLLTNAVSTTSAILAGFLLSVAVGIPLAVLISSSRV